jgi:hypothetical protein
MKTIFELGDNVFDYQFGWGEIVEITEDGLFCNEVNFGHNSLRYTTDGRLLLESAPTLSFTEYTIKGFSQERPELLPEKGDVVWVRGCESEEWTIAYFIEKQDNCYLINLFNPHNEGQAIWYNFLTTINPYKK